MQYVPSTLFVIAAGSESKSVWIDCIENVELLITIVMQSKMSWTKPSKTVIACFYIPIPPM